MKFRLVEGYRGIADAVIALQRGELKASATVTMRSKRRGNTSS
jgi:hypothetical protein